MKSIRTIWPVLAACCLLSGALSLTGCGGSKGTRGDGSAGIMPDGAGPSADGVVSDTPMGGGGSGGGSGYDGPPGLGGSGGAVRGGVTGVDANTSKNDSALGGAGGTTRATGGGAAGGSGGGGSLVGGGSAGRGGTSGTGGTVGKGDAAVVGGADAGRDAASSSGVDPDGELPICPFVVKDTWPGMTCSELGYTGTCRDSQSPGTCRCDGWLDCSRSCPATAVPGGACLSSITQPCFYESLGLCQCKANLVGDAANSYSFSCPQARLDAGPPDTAPDARLLVYRNVPCSGEPTFGECTTSDTGRRTCGLCERPAGVDMYSCSLADGKSVCTCDFASAGLNWNCGASTCPDDVRNLDPCEEPGRACRNSQGQVCNCAFAIGRTGGVEQVFVCRTLSH